MTVLLDTNIILRYLTNDTPQMAQKVTQRFSEAKNGKLSLKINDFVVVEVIFLLEHYYHFPREQIVSVLGNLFSQPFLEMDYKDAIFEALIEYGHSQIDFVDCLLYAQAHQSEAKILSFDKHLDKFPLPLRLEP